MPRRQTHGGAWFGLLHQGWVRRLALVPPKLVHAVQSRMPSLHLTVPWVHSSIVAQSSFLHPFCALSRSL